MNEDFYVYNTIKMGFLQGRINIFCWVKWKKLGHLPINLKREKDIIFKVFKTTGY